MTNELHLTRRLRHLAFAIGLTLAGAGAHAQDGAPPADPGITGAVTQQDGDGPPPPSARRGRRGEIRPYLEVAQVLSADLDGGETLTYTSVAAGVDGHIETRRVTARMSLRYEHHFDWQSRSGDQDVVSGVAQVHAEVAPGVLSLDAGALATRTGGNGRTFGVTNRDAAVDVYGVYAGPTLATHAGPLAINGAYRFGYARVDDHRPGGQLDDDFDSSTAHSLTGSVGMAPNRGLPFGWTVGAGYARENSGGRFRNRFEGAYVRGDVVVPISPTLALTAGVGYEDIQASQRDVVRDAGGVPVPDAQGRLQPDPSAPRLLTYDMNGIMYDGGILWRPSPRTELQARAGHRYGGTTYVGSLSHRLGRHSAVNAVVYDTVETFGRQLTTQISGLPANFNVNRDPLSGGLGGCVFGQTGGGACFDRSLQSITGSTFRARGVNVAFSGERRLWTYGIGAGYNHRRYYLPSGAAFVTTQASHDQDVSVYGNVGRRLSRTSDINLNAYVSWYDSDLPGAEAVTSEGATLSYNRSFLLERLRLLAALGVYHSDDGTDSATNASALAGLRYTF
ncbi:MAG TPA: hypothetical protein VGW40_16520 [Allosphingosinicella sp.]|nr:hypothetical protein [Allosphingosinicella sp.]